VTFEIPGLLKHTKRETSREDKLTNKVQRPVAETKHIGGRLDTGKLPEASSGGGLHRKPTKRLNITKVQCWWAAPKAFVLSTVLLPAPNGCGGGVLKLTDIISLTCFVVVWLALQG
jgi:hypothetical protein